MTSTSSPLGFTRAPAPTAAAPAVATPVQVHGWRRWLGSLGYTGDVRGRDLRYDFLRGFLVFSMIANHIGGTSALALLTGGNRFFVSAAEGFLFVSGLMMGLVFQRRIAKAGFWPALWSAERRGFVLYLLNVTLTAAFVAASLALGAWWVEGYTADPFQFAASVLTLGQTFYLVDIIHLYAILLLGSFWVLFLLNRGLWWLVLAISVGLWAGYQVWPDVMPTRGIDSSFPLSAWQIFFATGMLIGWYREPIGRLLGRLPRVPLFAVLTIAAALTIALYNDPYAQIVERLYASPAMGGLIDSLYYKYSVGAGRLVVAAIFFAWAFLAVTLFWRPLERALGWLFRPLGEHALYAYTLHLFVVLFVATVLADLPPFQQDALLVNTVVQVAGIGLIWLLIRKRVLFNVIPS